MQYTFSYLDATKLYTTGPLILLFRATADCWVSLFSARLLSTLSETAAEVFGRLLLVPASVNRDSSPFGRGSPTFSPPRPNAAIVCHCGAVL